jgi:hypothetical protein
MYLWIKNNSIPNLERLKEVVLIIKINGVELSNHYFSMLLFMIIRRYFPQKHYKCIDRNRWVVYRGGDYFGLLFCFSDKTIKVFYGGTCIQYFTSLHDFDEWIKKGCTKETLFMMKEN